MATVGTTVQNAYDPIKEIAAVCKERGIWLHADVRAIDGDENWAKDVICRVLKPDALIGM